MDRVENLFGMIRPFDQARRLVYRYGFDDRLLSLLEPALLLRVSPADFHSLPVGASRFGAIPDLPPDIEWPVHSGKRMTLLAQLRLEEVAPYDVNALLPRSGWLCFFFARASGDKGASSAEPLAVVQKVVHFDGEDSHLRRFQQASPETMMEPYPCCRMDLCGFYTLPYRSSAKVRPFVELGESWDRYGDLLSALRYQGNQHLPRMAHASFLSRLLGGGGRCGFHQLLGYPERFDLDVQRLPPSVIGQDQSVQAWGRVPGDWTLLLQVHPDRRGLGCFWGEDVCLFFVAPRQSLRGQDFDQVRAFCSRLG